MGPTLITCVLLFVAGYPSPAVKACSSPVCCCVLRAIHRRAGMLITSVPQGFPAMWSHPYAVAVNNEENSILISDCPPLGTGGSVDTKTQRLTGSVTKFTQRGEFLGTTSMASPLREPTSIAVDSASQVR